MSGKEVHFGSVVESEVPKQTGSTFISAVADKEPSIIRSPSDASIFSHVSGDSEEDPTHSVDEGEALVDTRVPSQGGLGPAQQQSRDSLANPKGVDIPAVAGIEQELQGDAAPAVAEMGPQLGEQRKPRNTAPILKAQRESLASDLLNDRPDVGNVGFLLW